MIENDPPPIDATIDIITPENISFRYRIAGPYRRLPAFFIDVLLRFGVWIVIFIVLSLISAVSLLNTFLGQTIAGVLFFLMEWLYGGLLETYWNGQTVGKRVMGIRVLSVDGQPINGLQAFLRNILRFADLMPLVSLSALMDVEDPIPIPTLVIGLVTTLLTRRFQRLGDIVCGTMVVIDEKSWLFEPAKLEDPRVAQLAAELPPSFVVSRTMAQALATYVDRRQLFSPPRRREIARHIAEPLLPKFGLPSDTSYDLLLCALYHRTFLSEDNEVTLSNPYNEMQRQLEETQRPIVLAPIAKPMPAKADVASTLSDAMPAIPDDGQPQFHNATVTASSSSQDPQSASETESEPGSPFKPNGGSQQ